MTSSTFNSTTDSKLSSSSRVTTKTEPSSPPSTRLGSFSPSSEPKPLTKSIQSTEINSTEWPTETSPSKETRPDTPTTKSELSRAHRNEVSSNLPTMRTSQTILNNYKSFQLILKVIKNTLLRFSDKLQLLSL